MAKATRCTCGTSSHSRTAPTGSMTCTPRTGRTNTTIAVTFRHQHARSSHHAKSRPTHPICHQNQWRHRVRLPIHRWCVHTPPNEPLIFHTHVRGRVGGWGPPFPQTPRFKKNCERKTGWANTAHISGIPFFTFGGSLIHINIHVC